MLFESSHCNRLHLAASSLLLCITLMWTVTSRAEETEQTRWYDVEVIIFGQNSQQYRDSEMWLPEYDLPAQEETQELLPVAGDTQGMPVPFSRLAEQSLRLSAEARRIDEAPDTELLLHLGWRQPGLAEDKAVAVWVDDGMQSGQQQPSTEASADEAGGLPLEEKPAHRMEGTLKLVLSRYLHIYTDLIYREPLSEELSGTGTFQESIPGQGEVDLFAVAEDPFTFSLQPRYQVYRLKQSRRMRSRELHYLDHPVFGMAILVTPYEPPKEETVESGNTPAE